MYYVIEINPKTEIALKEKRKYIDSIWGSREKMGIIEKFCKAIQTIIPVEESKETIMDAIIATPFQTSVAKFYFKETETVIADKWMNFMKKVYPDLEVKSYKTQVLYDTLDFVLSYLFTNMENTPVCLEVSLSERLDKKEIKQVKILVDEMKSGDLYYVCRQFECEDCYEKNPKTPIHFELDNHYKADYIKKQKDNPNSELAICETCKELLYKGECEICNYPYEFKF